MKRWIVSIAVLTSLCGYASAAISTSWGAGISGAYLYNSLGVLLDSGLADYRVELVIDVDGDTDFSAMLNGYVGLTGDTGWGAALHASASDDVIWAADARLWLDAGGGLSYIPETASNIADQYADKTFYFRWFNADSQANATEAGIIYGAGGGWTIGDNTAVPPVPSDIATLDYDEAISLGTEYTDGINDGWQTIAPIPEPGTIGLFLIGAGVLAYRKRRSA